MTLEIKLLFALNMVLSLNCGLAGCVRQQKLFMGLQIEWSREDGVARREVL